MLTSDLFCINATCHVYFISIYFTSHVYFMSIGFLYVSDNTINKQIISQVRIVLASTPLNVFAADYL